jgi:thiol-disulfide isomerase/thioredoxin
VNRGALLAVLGGSLVAATRAAATTTPALRSLHLATAWIGPQMALERLRGRVVLVDVFTFECINCVHITPNLKRLYATYPRSALEIIAVHTPEVPSYQSRPGYVAHQAQAAGLPWPIALDNDHRIWDAYGVDAWPTQLIFDKTGRYRATIIGDSLDQHVNAVVGSLI